MAIEIYNTLTRSKQKFIPLKPDEVSIYVCGPTVYNYIHIGNARSSAAFDTIRRYLEYRGYRVNYISNFTDVDDKIIKAAKEEQISPQALADKYIQAFIEDTSAINIKPATEHPRVVDHIQDIINFIQVLIDKGHAYAVSGDVYFRTETFSDYGALANKTVDQLRVGASQRTSTTDTQRKENPVDFALWKGVEDSQEISWSSPWGQGRPGWHIECSVMSTKYLGPTIDIHGGGQDLEFPHHENEIAQSECYWDQTFANYWMHNGFVTIGKDGDKMSKSLGNFVLLRDLVKQVDPMVVRFLLSSIHYRKPLKFDQEAIQDAQSNLERLREVLRRLDYRYQDCHQSHDQDQDQNWLERLEQHELDFVKAMDDDFNSANGITEIFQLVRTCNLYLDQDSQSQHVLLAMKQTMIQLLAIFGIQFDKEELLDQEIQVLIDERQQARLDKNYQRADEIRDALKQQGILLDDTAHGTTWKRVNFDGI